MPLEPRRIWNPPNPYLGRYAELLEEPPAAELEVYEDRSRSIISHSESLENGVMWSVNPYRGCFHACAYCYARPTHEYLGLGAGTDFERKLFVKKDAPRLLEAAFRRPSWKGDTITFSGVTDCYQPLEASFGVTRTCLEVCLAYRNPAAVITKSALVRRDAALLASLEKEASAAVFFSIPFQDEKVARALEPGAPSVHKRFETMEILARAGVPVGISVSPVIPGLNEPDVPGLLKEAKAKGARYAFHTLLHLPGSAKEVFLHRLRESLPLRAGKIEHQLSVAHGGAIGNVRRGRGRDWEMFRRTWELWTRRLGFNSEEPDRPSTFARAEAPKSARKDPAQPEFAWSHAATNLL